MLLTFKNKAGNMVSVKAIDIKHIVEMPEDNKILCHIVNYPSDRNDEPKYYVSEESFVELRNRWQIALQAWNNSITPTLTD